MLSLTKEGCLLQQTPFRSPTPKVEFPKRTIYLSVRGAHPGLNRVVLNNAINHGVFTPIGTEQALEAGKSILFMIESNPGPGLGLLLAYCVAGKGETRSSAGAAAVIQFVGGIHEIYFPYVLMNPIVILGPNTMSTFSASPVRE